MQVVDWIVVGNGLAGAALSYELVRQGYSVLLIDDANPDNATAYSYGGIAYWSGTDDVSRELCAAGIERHRQLSEELGMATGFRELDLLLTITADEDLTAADIQAIGQAYQHYAIPPQLVSVETACEIEPQLAASAIAGALTVKHGHVSPKQIVAAFNQAFRRLGGQQLLAQVTGLVRVGDRVTGVMTPTQAYAAGQVAIATGGYTRSLLQAIQVSLPLYHTQAEIVAVPPIEAPLRALIMSARADRFVAEAKVSQPEYESSWQTGNSELLPPVLDAGVIQFSDQSLFIGQISRFSPALNPAVDAAVSKAQLQTAIARQLPILATVDGTWHRCLVTFSRDGLPLIGPVPGLSGVQIFSGFTSPFAMLLPIAQRFARWVGGTEDPLIPKMLISRFE